jgi:phosphoserine aminotransferase
MTRVFNFSAGPAVLPEPVLRQAAEEMLDWHGSGMSVMEMSHRGKEFIAIHAEAEALLRELMADPGELQGALHAGRGDRRERDRADEPAARQGQRRLHPHRRVVEEVDRRGEALLQGEQSPPAPRRAASPRCRRARAGSSTPMPPTCTSAPTRRSAASNTTSRPTPAPCRWWPTCRATSSRARSTWRRYGLIYGGRTEEHRPGRPDDRDRRDDLIGQAHPLTPSAFDYQQQAANDSMLNTPPTYAIYIAGLVFRWIKARGGLAAMAEHNRAKAALLYDYLDRKRLLPQPGGARRSLADERALQAEGRDARRRLLKGAQAAGMVQLKGHRSVGGMRASIYNAMPIEGVQALVAYMKEFEARHG